MTVIAGLVEGGVAYLAADSYTSSDTTTVRLPIGATTPKLFRVGEMAVGISGESRIGHVLRHAVHLPAYPPSLDPLRAVVELADRLRAEMEARKGLNDDGLMDGDCLVGFRGRLFQIDCSFAVIEWDTPYAATGSGDGIAVGSLATTAEPYFAGMDMDPQLRLATALRVAALHVSSVQEPFVFLSAPAAGA
ncbi:MAG TPA: hypothetical protein VFR37_10760 [Longimicrobium sp.]|nr:hypothetical protein [Longimicrobium sp.]